MNTCSKLRTVQVYDRQQNPEGVDAVCLISDFREYSGSFPNSKKTSLSDKIRPYLKGVLCELDG